jgi:hypothetical protein
VAPRRAFGIRTAFIAARVVGLTSVVAALLAVTCVLLSVQAQAVDAAQPITVPFDHLPTGFELDGVHRDLPCEACHLNAVFKGTPRDCGTCHIMGSLYNATPKTATHIPTTNYCGACHNTIAFRPDVHFDHAQVLGSCVSCHNGTIAQGEGPNHPATSQDCGACHTVISWNPPKAVDHTQIPMAVAGFCIICHNGTAASGKNVGHLVTNLECGDCHLTTTWLGADFDHTGIRTGCVSCHNGTKAVGKQANHMPTTNLCENCHTTGIGTKLPNWAPSLFDHTQMTVTTCQTCHSGSVKISTGFVSGQPANHVPPIPSSIDCGVCHGNSPAAETWTTLAGTIATLHSGLSVGNCLLCHAGQTFAGVPAPYIPMSISGVSPTKMTPLAPPHIPILAGADCSACHGAAYQAGGFGPATAMSAATHAFVSSSCDTCHDTGKSFYVGSGTPLQLRPADHLNSTDPAMATGDCSMCHETKDWLSTTLPTGHMPNPSNLTCVQCHASAPSDYTPATLAALSALHTGITGNCGLCHGNTTTALTWANNYTPKDALLAPSHIPYLSGTDCSSCHSSSTYAIGTFGPMNMTQAKHSFVATSCDTCHEAGLSFYMGAASPALQGRPADHNAGQMLAPNDCSICHTTANWNSTALPPGHMPNPGNLTCAQCHTSAPSDYTPPTLASNAVFHTGITGNCGLCHGNTVTALTWYNNFTPKDALLAPSHIPYLSGTDCSSCHSSSTYAVGTFGPMNMTQAKHSFVATSCDTCHEAGLSFYVGAASPALQGRPADHNAGQMLAPNDCSICHTTANWNSTALPPGHMPNPGNLTCAQCHTSAPSDYTPPTLASNSVLHTGITGNCGQCHGNTTTALTWYNAFTPKDAILAPAHIPYTSGTDCSSCHSSSTYAVGTFGPMNMNQAKHAFVAATCDTCHEAGLSFFMGGASPTLQGRPSDHTGSLAAPNDCSGCHTTANWNSTTLPAGHMPNPSNLTCTQCHTSAPSDYTTTTLAANSVLHTGIGGNCGQCHGNTTTALTWYNSFTPKDAILTPPHLPYTSGTDCSSCHSSTTYAAGTFGPMNMTAAKHAFVPTTCITCHEAGSAFYLGASSPALQTRPADHLSSGDQEQKTGDCSICHNTTNWLSSTLPIGHMPNPGNQACAVCHIAIDGTFAGYATLASIAVLHTGITNNCQQCHGATTQLTFFNNNDNPKDGVLTPPHIPYLSGTDCSSCHAANYVAGGFGPTSMSAAKHTFVPKSCDSCHDASAGPLYMGAATPALQLRPADHTAGLQLTGDCSGCHTTTDWTSNVMPAGHMPNPGNQTCSACHTAAPTNYTTFAGIAVLHTGISGNCSQCHGDLAALSFYNNGDIPNEVPKYAAAVAHIPYLNGADCSSCHSTNYVAGGFGPATAMSAAKHAFVPTTCDTCHDSATAYYTGSGTPLQERPPTHISAPNPPSQATGDCSLCHTTTDWTSPTTLPNGHMPIPGTQTCSVCHTAIVAGNINSYATLASIAILHTGVTSGCAQCHGGATQLMFYNNNDNPKAAAALSPPHIPAFTGEDCSSCHAANYIAGGFGPMNMTQATHAGVGSTCGGCHEAGLSFYMGAASPALQGRPADHTAGNMVAPNDCSLCHTTANWNSSTLPAGHMPNPANQTCSVCHTAAPTNYATLAANSVLHTGISNGCAQCHGATSQLMFYNNNDNPKDAVLAPAHIPYLSGTDCSACHSSSTYAVGGFGPMNMTQATHAVVATSCDTCHGTATVSFYMGAASPGLQLRPADHTSGSMLTGDCSGCHTTANWNSSTLPAGHMPNPANQACTVCHATAPADYTPATLAANSVLHTGIAGNCGQCHGATTALVWYNNFTPKDAILAPAHIPYLPGTDCSSCHSSSTYATGTFGPMNMTQAKHAFVPTSCNTCHEAGLSFYMGAANPALQGRPADHTAGNMVAPNDCSLCHTTANWNSTTLPAGHMPNPANLACAVCHATAPADYTPATLAANSVLHTGITGNCGQCHGAAAALTWYNNFTPKDAVLAPAHIPYTSGTDCSACHSSSTYAAGTFGPMNMTQAKHAFVPTTCDTCHEAGLSFYMGAASPALQGRPADHNSGQMLAPNDCAICHTTANWNSSTMPAGHMPNPANLACNVCHTAAPTNYTTLALNSVLHTGITGNCGQCHGALAALTWYNNFTPKDAVLAPAHVPYTSGTDCSSCHSSSTYAAGTFGPMNMTQAKHTFVPASCNTCHEAGLSFYMGAASPALQGRPADHTAGNMVAPNDCSLCHTTANWNSSTLPAGHMPNPANQTCSVCHTAAPTNYATLAANSVLHTGISNGCAQCHGATSQLMFYNNNDNPKDAVLAPAHIPFLSGTDCGSCHSSTTYAVGGFGPMNMSAATHAFVVTTCDTCHGTATVSFYMGAASPALQLRPADHTTGTMLTGDCGGCHTTSTWNSTALPAGHMPNPGNQACTICHIAAPTTYATLAANAVLHTGISSGCITCHGAPNATPPVFYLNYTPKDAVLAPVHIPTGTTPCESCHTATIFTAFSGTTMTAAKHTTMFTVIGKTCDACHETGDAFYGVTNLTTRPSGHHVGQDCSGCHSPNNWGGGNAKKVAAVTATGSKVSAVVGAPALAGGAVNLTSAANSTLAADVANAVAAGVARSTAAAGMSHAGVTSNCFSCHNGVLATGKPANHIASNNTCQNCHTTLAWLPARFDHQGVTAMCSTCHNGVLASGKPTQHVQTTQDCAACHGTITWTVATFSHVGVSATCRSCHNGVLAASKPVTHVITTLDCGSCHSTLNWTVTAPPAPLRRLVLPSPRASTSRSVK